MRSMNASLPILGALLLTAAAASAQGLLALRNQNNFREDQPFAWTASVNGGFDKLDYKASDIEDIDSFFISGQAGLMYGDADQRTPWNLGIEGGAMHYLDDAERYDDTYYNARVSFDIVHNASKRLKLVNNFYLAYEVEPDYAIGASTSLRNGQYLYGYENFALSYAWSERFSTTTSYTLDGIRYEDEVVSGFEDRLSHVIAQQFSYALKRTTQLVAEYRFRTTNYDSADNDFDSHYALLGVDHAWSERTSGSVRAGAELYSSDRVEETAPYAELAVDHAVSKQTTARFYGAIGFDGAELGDYESRYSYRFGVTGTRQISDRFSLNAGAHFVHSDYDGDGETTTDVSENNVHGSLGLAYRLWHNVSMQANYSYTLLNSDDEFREFDRSRIALGLSAQF